MLVLDTDVVIDMLRAYRPALRWFESVSQRASVVVPGYVALELFARRAKIAEARTFLNSVEIRWPSRKTVKQSVDPIARVAKTGITPWDLLIGLTAREMNETLYTRNTRHFRSIPGLRVASPVYRRH